MLVLRMEVINHSRKTFYYFNNIFKSANISLPDSRSGKFSRYIVEWRNFSTLDQYFQLIL